MLLWTRLVQLPSSPILLNYSALTINSEITQLQSQAEQDQIQTCSALPMEDVAVVIWPPKKSREPSNCYINAANMTLQKYRCFLKTLLNPACFVPLTLVGALTPKQLSWLREGWFPFPTMQLDAPRTAKSQRHWPSSPKFWWQNSCLQVAIPGFLWMDHSRKRSDSELKAGTSPQPQNT